MPHNLVPLLFFFAAGCAADEEVNANCDALCTVLVQECAYTAYPSLDSCMQGCVYNQAQGADVAGQLECIEDAGECDTFAIAECEHAYND